MYVVYVLDEEFGGVDGMGKFVVLDEYFKFNVGVNLDEGLVCLEDFYWIYFGERLVWKFVIKVVGVLGYGVKLIEGSVMENLCDSLSLIYEYCVKEFWMLKEGLKIEGEVVVVNNVFF